MEMPEMIAAVRSYAEARYDKGRGWDYVVEAFDDEELAEEIGEAKNEKEAIRNVRKTVHLLAERRDEVRSLAW